MGKNFTKTAENLNKPSLSYRNLRLYRQFFLEFRELEHPVFDYVLIEFRAEEQLIPIIKQELISDSNIISNLAITDCQIQNNNSNWANSVCPIPKKEIQSLTSRFTTTPRKTFQMSFFYSFFFNHDC